MLSLAMAGLALAAAMPDAHAETDPSQGRLISNEAIAVNPTTNKVYAVNEPAGTVSVLDERTGVTHEVKVGAGPVSLAIDSVTNRIYVVNADSDSVSVIDGRNDRAVATLRERPGSYPYVVAVDDVADKIYVTNTYNNALLVIDGATNVVHTMTTGSADAIAIDSRRHTIFLMTYEDPDIRLVNPATGAIRRIRVGPHLWGMAFDQALNTLYVAHTLSNNIVALNEETLKAKTIPAGSTPCAVAIDPVTQRLYAVNYESQTLSVIDARTNKVLAVLRAGKHPQAVAVDSRHSLVYVANVHGNSVTVIDAATNRVLGTLPAGRNPYALAVASKLGRAFAEDYGEPPIAPLRSLRGAAQSSQH